MTKKKKPKLPKIVGMSYADPKVPADYSCKTCRAKGVKLWRESNSFQIELFCADCAGKAQNKDVSTIDERGRRLTPEGDRTDQIGWLLPAVPDEEGLGYWSYTSVPDAGVAWWRALPSRPEPPAFTVGDAP